MKERVRRPAAASAVSAALGFAVLCGCAADYDLIVRGGRIYDGTGAPPYTADLGVRGDRIAAIGDLSGKTAHSEIDASGLAVAPGFINMLSWSTESLLADGRSLGELRQGVTTQIMGEGHSMGPLNEEMKARMRASQGDIRFEVAWTALAEYLEHLERRGISQNVASFVGAATLREYVIGLNNRRATPEELETMCRLLEEAMQEGALGVASSLIYAPGSFADTEELIALAQVASKYGGAYASHIRSEGDRLLEALDEFLAIVRAAGVRGEIYHLKAAGESNWTKLDQAIAKIEEARAAGLEVTADIYPYTAAATGLDASIPLWARDGGYDAMWERFRDPALRPRIIEEIRTGGGDWENLYRAAGSPERILLVHFKNPRLKHLQGKTLAEAARLRGKSPEETILDLMYEDRSRVGTVYFVMSEDNVRKKAALPWVSICSDAASMAAEGVFLRMSAHPRAYGSFARFLGRYVRDEGLVPLEEAVRRMTSLPASVLRLDRRGLLREGWYADIVVFDPERIIDRATYDNPHRYAEGVRDVIVNGVPALLEGKHTGMFPGRALRGPGARSRKQTTQRRLP